MSTITASLQQEDDVFRAFALGDKLDGEMTCSVDLGKGNTALMSHGVLIALRSEECVVFDAGPHADGCPVLCRVMAHIGRAGVHVAEHYGDDEMSALDHGAFVALAGRLGAVT